MPRSRARATGRRGSEAQRFALLPEDVLLSAALAKAGHATLRVLVALVCGQARERNGLMMCSESYAERFGLAKSTVSLALAELETRKLIVRTRRVKKFSKHATLWAVTWWPIYFRDGQPLRYPEPASHDYLKWSHITPTVGVGETDPKSVTSPRRSIGHTPTIGVNTPSHHPDGRRATPKVHPDGRGHSKNLPGGTSFEITLETHA